MWKVEITFNLQILSLYKRLQTKNTQEHLKRAAENKVKVLHYKTESVFPCTVFLTAKSLSKVSDFSDMFFICFPSCLRIQSIVPCKVPI